MFGFLLLADSYGVAVLGEDCNQCIPVCGCLAVDFIAHLLHPVYSSSGGYS